MTRDEVRADVDAAVDAFFQFIAEQNAETSGIRPPPRIDEEITELPPQPFDFGILQQPGSSASDLLGGIIITYGPLGACCFCDGDCDVLSERECQDEGGEWHDDTEDCEEAECQTQGACCEDDECTVVNADDCTGDYQGDCSTCVPNPCAIDCECGFGAFDGSERKFLTRTTVRTVTFEAVAGSSGTQHVDFVCTFTDTMDPETCVVSTVCECSGSCHENSCCFGEGECDCTLAAAVLCNGFDYSGCGSCSVVIPPCVPGNCDGCQETSNFLYTANNCVGLYHCGPCVPSSATHCHKTNTWDGEGTISDETDVDLSHECNPI